LALAHFGLITFFLSRRDLSRFGFVCVGGPRRAVFSEEKKLWIAALSQQLPERLMLQARSWSASNRWSGSLVQHGLGLASLPDRHHQHIGDLLSSLPAWTGD
jgi:hypothetical protein